MSYATRTLTKKAPAVAVEEVVTLATAEMAARSRVMKRGLAAAVEGVATKPQTTRSGTSACREHSDNKRV